MSDAWTAAAERGDRPIEDTWAADISRIAQRLISLIDARLDEPGAETTAFEGFVAALRDSVDPGIERPQAVELVAQHLITMPIFAALFPEGAFSRANPVSAALEGAAAGFAASTAVAAAVEPLDEFYTRVTRRIRDLPDVRSRQSLLATLYDRFFSQAFPALADRMGIVFTPVEVVDYVLRSADEALHRAFGRRLGDAGVRLLDPFTGTGTFLTRLLQSGLIAPEDLRRSYAHELFANEIVPLSSHIAAVNIESVYREVCAEQGVEAGDGGFPGISLVDTFGLYERESEAAAGTPDVDTDRMIRQRRSEIGVIVMNPPYSVGQRSANDNNQNARYPSLDRAIRRSYAARSTARNTRGLYDSYYRALRWASDRIGTEGVIALVSNSGFVDGRAADGVRLTWAEEFSEVFVYNLRGGVRGRRGEAARREGGNVFDVMVGIAITVLVKSATGTGPARIHYREMADGLSRGEKLSLLAAEGSIARGGFRELRPNAAGDWIDQRDERFATYQPIAESPSGGAVPQGVFRVSSNGLKTNRDAWCYGFGAQEVAGNMRRLIANVNAVVAGTNAFDPDDPRHVNWTRALRRDTARRVRQSWRAGALRPSDYRPFVRQWAYVDRSMNDMVYRLPRLFPTAAHENRVIVVPAGPSADRFMPLMHGRIPALTPNGGNRLFPRWTWEPLAARDGDADADPEHLREGPEFVLDGYRRVDNITDRTLAAYRRTYGDDEIGKDDVFAYVYALLHHPDYRERHRSELRRLPPHIPRCAGFAEYARIGRELAALHLDYESVPGHALREEWSGDPPADADARYRIERPSWARRGERTAIRVNEHLTLAGIPEEAGDYAVGGRSPLEWVLDRYRIRVDAASGIVDDPNDWLREQGNPRYLVELIGSLVTLSLRTQRLIAELPGLEVIDPA